MNVKKLYCIECVENYSTYGVVNSTFSVKKPQIL